MRDPQEILARLKELREADAPTHGGRVLSYVYDSGLPELDRLAANAMELVQPVNGLDPTTFTSVAVMEREVIGFARDLLGGDKDVVGTVTSGGTESCLLAVKTARSNYQGAGTPKIIAPTTVHAAFHKAAEYFGLKLELIPVGSRRARQGIGTDREAGARRRLGGALRSLLPLCGDGPRGRSCRSCRRTRN